MTSATRWVVVVVTQHDWDGQGNDRSFTSHVRASALDTKLRDVARAYNLANGRTSVTVNGKAVQL